MIVNGNRLELPQDQHFKNYAAVKKALINAGGKYKKNGFEFNHGAQEVYDGFLKGDQMNKKKEFQFFETPEDLSKHVLELADIKPHHIVLEPSAGRGALLKFCRASNVICVELDQRNSDALLNAGWTTIQGDFTGTYFDFQFDRIIANPPFTKGQDVAHVTKMVQHCKPGGRIVSIMSIGWQTKNDRKSTAFRNLLEDLDAQIIPVERGKFKESGTMVPTCIVVIDVKRPEGAG
ncbi:MAG: hypothetical protein NXI13_13850 [Proteobacteria bacterium]|nr:hypothetical protein [Pseudomonadota bacterium]